MRRAAFTFLLSLTIFPIAIHAQQANSDNPLTDQQKLGRRVFEQRCAVCHTLVAPPTNKTYGPTLYKDLIAGNEDGIREFIKNGSAGKMPGFKYGLEPSQIDAIIEYLKTVPRPRSAARPAAGGDANRVD
jgi:mono/diheme cytochrome c family protein